MRVASQEQPSIPIPLRVRRPVIVICPHVGCRFTASALSEGRALRAIAGHVVRAHWPEGTRHAHHD